MLCSLLDGASFNAFLLATDVEYSRTGTVIKGQERAKAKSKYDEDGEYSHSGLNTSTRVSDESALQS